MAGLEGGAAGGAPAGGGAGLQLSGGKATLPAAAFHGQPGALPAPAGWSSGLWAAQLLQQGGEDLITPPSNAEAPLVLGGGSARPVPQCLLCGGLGTSAVCGALRPVTYDGQPAAVHHLCAIWSPGCFQREVGAGRRPSPAAALAHMPECLPASPAPSGPPPPLAGLLRVCQPGGGGAAGTQPHLQRVRPGGRIATLRSARVRQLRSAGGAQLSVPRPGGPCMH